MIQHIFMNVLLAAVVFTGAQAQDDCSAQVQQAKTECDKKALRFQNEIISLKAELMEVKVELDSKKSCTEEDWLPRWMHPIYDQAAESVSTLSDITYTTVGQPLYEQAAPYVDQAKPHIERATLLTRDLSKKGFKALDGVQKHGVTKQLQQQASEKYSKTRQEVKEFLKSQMGKYRKLKKYASDDGAESIIRLFWTAILACITTLIVQRFLFGSHVKQPTIQQGTRR